MQRWRDRRAPASEGERWAKFELSLGRFAQGAGLLGGLVLAFTAFLSSVEPPIATAFRRQEMISWFPLLLTSFGVSGYTLVRKLSAYRSGFRAVHFLSSVAAFEIAILALGVAFLDHFNLLDLGRAIPWMYFASVLGLSVAFVSLALTWEGFGWRKLLSIAASLAVPASLISVPVLWPVSPSILVLLFNYDALSIVFAGSILHLIASSSEASQREVLKASDAKLGTLRADVENRLRAIAYRERAYVEREAHLEAERKELAEVSADVETRHAELTSLQARLDQQGRGLAELEGRLAKTRAEVESRVMDLDRKEKDLTGARGQLEALRLSLEEREQAIAGREKEVKRAEIEVKSREHVVETRNAELAQREGRLKKDGATIVARRDEAIGREKELQLKESEIQLKLERLEAQESKDVQQKMAELQDWESKILAKEREIGKMDVYYRQQLEELRHRQQDGDAYASALQSERDRIAKREEELNAREKKISDADANLAQRSQDVDRRWNELSEIQKQAEAKAREYAALYKDTKMREADFTATKDEIARKTTEFADREEKMRTAQAAIVVEGRKLQATYRDLLAQEKSLQKKEADLALRELEMSRTQVVRPRPVAKGSGEVDKDKYFEMWEQRMKEREDEFKRRVYQREKELEAQEAALKEQMRDVVAAGTVSSDSPLRASVEVATHRVGRYRTGTPRMDDLLLGGFSMNANILFVGPPFVGKEVMILNFIAEGLKSNVPAVILTTSKPPVEIAKEMAPVLPTFLEYDQLGLIRWIDASGSTPTKKITREGGTYRVPSAADFEGIITAVDRSEEDFRELNAEYFRFAYLSLSSAFSQSEEKSAIAFVQRFVNHLRQSKCIAAFALERGMHTDQQVEALQQLMDGVMVFRQDKGKTMMSVSGLGEAQTRDWVPYKFTTKALMMGSFQLERIR